MKNHLKFIVLVSLLLQISGCDYYIVSFRDVSNEAPYSKVVNRTFKSKSELIIHGYNQDSIPGKEIHAYSITQPPGASNRYILSRNTIPSGTLVTFIAIKRCTDCYLDIEPRIKIEITSDSLKSEYNAPIFIDASLLINVWGHNGDDFQFNTEYFVPAD